MIKIGDGQGFNCGMVKIPFPFSRYKVVFRFTVNPEVKPQGSYFSKALLKGLIFGGAYIGDRRGLSSEGSLRFQIDWASLIAESKFTIFFIHSVFKDNLPSTSSRRGRGVIFGGAL